MNVRRTDSTAGGATRIDFAPLPNAVTVAQTICSASPSVPGCRFIWGSTIPAPQPNSSHGLSARTCRPAPTTTGPRPALLCLQQLFDPAERGHDPARFEGHEHQLLRVARDLAERFEILLRDQVLGRAAGGSERLRDELDRLRFGLRDAQPRLCLTLGGQDRCLLRAFRVDDRGLL